MSRRLETLRQTLLGEDPAKIYRVIRADSQRTLLAGPDGPLILPPQSGIRPGDEILITDGNITPIGNSTPFTV